MPTATDTGTQAQAASGRGLLAALNGGLVGKVANVQLRNADMRLALEAEYKALEYTAPAQPVYWKSADQLVSGTVVPSQPYRVGAQDCRQYTVFLTQRDSTSEQRGTACRNEDGSWSLLA